jgi:hypothetical protein
VPPLASAKIPSHVSGRAPTGVEAPAGGFLQREPGCRTLQRFRVLRSDRKGVKGQSRSWPRRMASGWWPPLRPQSGDRAGTRRRAARRVQRRTVARRGKVDREPPVPHVLHSRRNRWDGCSCTEARRRHHTAGSRRSRHPAARRFCCEPHVPSLPLVGPPACHAGGGGWRAFAKLSNEVTDAHIHRGQ